MGKPFAADEADAEDEAEDIFEMSSI